MNISYWEYKSWLSHIDFLIIGSGIVGLHTALHLKTRFPSARIVVLEKGVLPQGASTKNAGFACFGSISEIVSDIEEHSEDMVMQLVQQRWQGLQQLRELLGDTAIGFKNYGGYEVFLDEDISLFHQCKEKIQQINTLLQPIFGADAFRLSPNSFQFKQVQEQYIMSPFESQIDTGKMMQTLLSKVQKLGVTILNGVEVTAVEEDADGVKVQTATFGLQAKRVLVATNGFASQLLQEEVRPARAQVLITKSIKDLPIKGTFHVDRGYYYFRNIDNRILLGGGRHLDFKTEETTAFGQTDLVQEKLESLLRTTILPNTPYEVEMRWSGIMGVGKQKKPIVKQMSNHIYCGVRLGGMGVAIGSAVGKELAELV